MPATVLSSYWNAGALPDPNFGDNQLMISDSFFYADFWYRTEFTAQPPPAGRHAFLNFDGVNWKAEVFLNGERLGRIEGAFTRGRFDVTGSCGRGETRWPCAIEKNATPGSAKQKTLESAGPQRRRPGRGQPDLPRLDRLGLDPDRARPEHRHLERRLPDVDRTGDDRGPVRAHDAAAAGHLDAPT